jgi:hypothetical protein
MKGGVANYDTAEQAIREYVAARRAEFSFTQRIERMRWEKNVLAPAVDDVKQEILEGRMPKLELPRGT